MLQPAYTIPSPPFVPKDKIETIETVAILRQLAMTNRLLAEFKGRAKAIPNENILIDTLSLQEAKASSEIENIVTTQDELFRAETAPDDLAPPAIKEVRRYRDSLKKGFQLLKEREYLISNNTLIEIYRQLKQRQDGFRNAGSDTVLENEKTKKVIYVPPQDPHQIEHCMKDLEQFINDDSLCSLDPLIKMAIIHHQFESIHPFSDGNGRVGRILNALYLTKQGLLDTPTLYLSRAIIQSKRDYYRLLQAVRDEGSWEEWIMYMLKAVEQASRVALRLTEGIGSLMKRHKKRIRDDLRPIYSQDLLNNLFLHPYTRIDYLRENLNISRPTASKYLSQLNAAGLVEKRRIGRDNYYINSGLVELLYETAGP